jgi:WD40 repeat protein
VNWSHDGSKIASGSWDRTVRVWDSSTGAVLSNLEGHSGMVTSVIWSPDGSKIASWSYDKTVRVWDSSTGAVLSTLEGHSGVVTLVSWCPDGSKMASGYLLKPIEGDDKLVR